MLQSIDSTEYRSLMEAEGLTVDRPRVYRTPWYRTRCCKIIGVSLTCTGFLLFFTMALYTLLHDRPESVLFLVTSVICLAVFVHLVTKDDPPLATTRPATAVPVQVSSRVSLRSLFRRSEDEQARSLDPERADSISSVPAYILIPADQVSEGSNASTESTLVADSCQEQQHEDASELPKQDVSQPSVTDDSSAATKLQEAAAVISKIVQEAVDGKEVNSSSGETTSIEKISEKSSEAESEGVRQRKITPMEPQEHISLPDDGKKE